MKKQLISFILIFTMILTMLPQFSIPIFAASTPDTSIGLDLSDCTSDWTGTGAYTGVSWVSGAKSLTLTNANIHGRDNASGSFGIKVPDGTTVILNGNNTITGGISADTSNYGLFSTGALTIQGTGSLVSTGGLNTGITGYSMGIYASTLTISGGTVTATGGSSAIVSGGSSNGICVVTTVTISGGILTATAGSAYSSIGMLANTVNLNAGLFVARAGVGGAESKAFKRPNGAATIINYGTDMGALTGSPTANYAMYGVISTYKVSTAGLDFSGNPVDTGNLITDGYQWVQGTKTLTISNLILSTTVLSAIKLPDGAILDVQGTNVIRSGDTAADSAKSYGINCAGALTIQDSGTITCFGGNLTGLITCSYGISSVKSISISGTTVNAFGGTADGYSYGIYGTGGASSINISSGNVTAIGGTATATTKTGGLNGSFSCGIMQPSNIIAISGGNITAIGGTVNLDDPNTASSGLYSLYPPTMSGGNIAAIGGTTANSSNGNSSGVYVNTGNRITILGGNITAMGYVSAFGSIGLTLNNNEEVPVASTNIDGSSPVTYVDSNLGTYKYMKIGIPTYLAAINLKKDGSAWTSSGKTITLQQASETPTLATEAGGVFTANVVNGTWKILADGTDTGSTIVINNGAVSQDLNYYTVQFAVTSTGTASGSAISATYDSSEIHTGDAVPGGKQLVITAVGQGSSNYTYVWSGAGANGETTEVLTIPSLSEAVNVICVVSSKAPKIMTASLPNGTVGTAYNQSVSVLTIAPITWGITAGVLPAGLILDPDTGAITGTPTTAGTYNFIVTATNSFGADTKTYTLTVTTNPVYTLTLAAGSGGTVSSSGGTYEAGASVNITATPNSNYSFSGWSTSNGGSFADERNASTAFTMPANNTTITAAFSYNGGGGGNGGGGSSAPTTTPTQVPIIVDNNNYYIGNVDVEDNIATITVDQPEFDKQLAAAKYSVVIPVTSDAKTVVAQLVVKNVQDMNDKGVPLSVQTGKIKYNIPASSIDTKAILSALGVTDPSLAPVNVIIKTDVNSVAQEFVNSAVEATGAYKVVPALQFEISASYNGKTCNIETFDHFVNRSIEINQEQAQQITTAIVVNPDGTTRHVPTFVYQKDGKWYAQINSRTNSTYALIFNQMSFSDAEGKWYQSVADEMGSRKIISGVGNNCFAGNKATTRAEFAAIVVRALGLPANGTATFSDVPSDSWYSGAVATAAQYDIIVGIGNNRFAPNTNITREEAMQMIYKASTLTPFVEVTGVDNTKSFADYGTQSAWATQAVNFNLNNGFIQGFNGRFSPKANITRAETAAVVLRLLQKSGLVDVRKKQ